MIWFGNLKILRGWNCIASRQESWNINLKDRPQGIDSLNSIQCWIWWSDKVSYSLRITGIKGFCGARIHCRYRNIFKAPNPVIYSRANNNSHGNKISAFFVQKKIKSKPMPNARKVNDTLDIFLDYTFKGQAANSGSLSKENKETFSGYSRSLYATVYPAIVHTWNFLASLPIRLLFLPSKYSGQSFVRSFVADVSRASFANNFLSVVTITAAKSHSRNGQLPPLWYDLGGSGNKMPVMAFKGRITCLYGHFSNKFIPLIFEQIEYLFLFIVIGMGCYYRQQIPERELPSITSYISWDKTYRMDAFFRKGSLFLDRINPFNLSSILK